MNIPEEILLIDDDAWNRVKISMAPELPFNEYKVDGVTYSITDLTYLNEYAKDTFAQLISLACDELLGESVNFTVDKSFGSNRLDIVMTILTNIRWKVSKKGKNGFRSEGTFLTLGYSVATFKGGDMGVTLDIQKDCARYIYEYAQKKKESEGSPLKINLHELVIAVLKREHEDLHKMAEKMIQEGDV